MNLLLLSHRSEIADGIGVHYYRLAEELPKGVILFTL